MRLKTFINWFNSPKHTPNEYSNPGISKKDAQKAIENTCGRGWFKLIDDVYNRLPKGALITSVYQKWGALRFDIDGIDDEFQNFLDDIEEQSRNICEVCGAYANEKIVEGWVETLCDKDFLEKTKV